MTTHTYSTSRQNKYPYTYRMNKIPGYPYCELSRNLSINANIFPVQTGEGGGREGGRSVQSLQGVAREKKKEGTSGLSPPLVSYLSHTYVIPK